MGSEMCIRDRFKSGSAYLFIANHRDIVMDPAFVNYAVYHAGLPTPRIAIGDNLLQKPFVSDLMRLNKSFIVHRSISGRREKMAAYQLLSAYINHSIRNDCASIWIAQAEGRAVRRSHSVAEPDPGVDQLRVRPLRSGQGPRALHPVSYTHLTLPTSDLV